MNKPSFATQSITGSLSEKSMMSGIISTPQT